MIYSFYDFVLNNILYAIPVSIRIIDICVIIAALIVLALYLIGRYKMLNKSGDSNPKAGLIPFYGLYKLYKVSVSVKYFWILLVVMAVDFILEILLLNSPTMVIVLQFYMWFYVADIIAIIVATIIWIISCYYIALSFGHKIGYTVGLVLFPAIFNMIIGFGKSIFTGNKFLVKEKEIQTKIDKRNQEAYKKAKEKANNNASK